MNKVLKSKIQATLDKVQNKATARLLYIENIEGIEKDNMKLVKELKKQGLKFKLVFHDGKMKKGYGYTSSCANITFKDNGRIENVNIFRGTYSNYINRIEIANFNELDSEIKKELKKQFKATNYGYINL